MGTSSQMAQARRAGLIRARVRSLRQYKRALEPSALGHARPGGSAVRARRPGLALVRHRGGQADHDAARREVHLGHVRARERDELRASRALEPDLEQIARAVVGDGHHLA